MNRCENPPLFDFFLTTRRVRDPAKPARCRATTDCRPRARPSSQKHPHRTQSWARDARSKDAGKLPHSGRSAKRRGSRCKCLSRGLLNQFPYTHEGAVATVGSPHNHWQGSQFNGMMKAQASIRQDAAASNPTAARTCVSWQMRRTGRKVRTKNEMPAGKEKAQGASRSAQKKKRAGKRLNESAMHRATQTLPVFLGP